MSNGNQPDAGSSAQELPEERSRGQESQSPESLEGIHESATIHRPIHEDATILGEPGIQATLADQSTAGGGLGSITDPSEFRRAVLEIGLATEEELDGLSASVPADAGVLGLARALQKAGKLTAYQAAALYQRKSRGLLIGSYVILDKLGVGGMGVVFKARHRRLGHVVALKILPPSFARDRTALARFKREVEAAGKLNHPNIVAALDADEDRGVHFLVMEYVEGRDLDRVVRGRGPLRVADAIEYVIQAARGLAAAHAEGIVHRDIKPSNLMLDTPGTVRVLDLGLARIVDASNPFGQAAGGRLTESGMYMGTIDYMAPEQADDSRTADQRADIYSLGCTLYYLMTGREPFVGETVLKRLMAHQERPAPPLRGARPDAPAVLEDTFQQMMAKRPADRPASMTAVIALLESCKAAAAAAPKSRPELKVFDEPAIKQAASKKADRDSSTFALGDESHGVPTGSELSLEDLFRDVRSAVPAAAPGPSTSKRVVQRQGHLPPQRGTRKTQAPRNKWRTPVLVALGSVVAVAAVVVGTRLVLDGSNARDQPGALSDPMLKTVPTPVTETPAVRTVPRDSSVSTPKTKTSPKTPSEFTTIFDGSSGKGWILCDGSPLPRANVQDGALNPHGARSELVVYEMPVDDFMLEFDFKLTDNGDAGVFLRVSDLNAPAETGLEIALDDSPRTATENSGALYDLVAPRRGASPESAGGWNRVRIAAQGPRVTVSLGGIEVTTIDLDRWTTPGKRPDGSVHKFQDVAFGKLPRAGYLGFQGLYSNCWFKNVRVSTSSLSSRLARAVPSYVETGQFTGHKVAQGGLASVALAPDGRVLSGGSDGMARLWELGTGRELHALPNHGMVWSTAFSPDGHHALTASHDFGVRYWDLDRGRLIFAKRDVHTSHVKAVAFFPDGLRALSAGDDDVVMLWDLKQLRPMGPVGKHGGDIECLAIFPDGRLALSGGQDKVVKVWDFGTGREQSALTIHKHVIICVAFSPDGRKALTSSLDKAVIVWDVASRKEIGRAELPGGGVVTSAKFLTDGRSVLTCSDTGKLVLWDIESGVAIRQHQGPSGHRRLAAWPDGSLVLTGDSDGIVRIWSPSPFRLPGAPAANLLVNGSFELGPDVQDVPLLPGSTAIPGWTVTREPIDCIQNALRAADGKRCLDMNGSPGIGGIRQSFLTAKGQRYRVTFAMAGSIGGGTTGNREFKRLGVSAAGVKSEFSFDTYGKSPEHMGWTTKTWEFVAVDGETSLEFYSVDRKNPLFGPALDDVRVVAQAN